MSNEDAVSGRATSDGHGETTVAAGTHGARTHATDASTG